MDNNIPYIVNFFSQRDYEHLPSMIQAGAKQVVTDPKTYGIRRKR